LARKHKINTPLPFQIGFFLGGRGEEFMEKQNLVTLLGTTLSELSSSSDSSS
jgi:hypothetical protein